MPFVLTVALIALAGCGETAQTSTERKADAVAWDNQAPEDFTERGWKRGDQAAWEEQMRRRAQAQNEYVRAPVTSP